MDNAEEKKPLPKVLFDFYYELYVEPVLSYFFDSKKKGNKKVPDPKLSYRSFEISNFKGIQNVKIDLIKNNLVLLLGLNESGKSTILKAIEAFDYLNDPIKESDEKFFQKIRNKSQVNSNKEVTITANISIDQDFPEIQASKIGDRVLSNEEKSEINSFIKHINEEKEVLITRAFPFKDGKLSKYHYRIEGKHPFTKNPLSRQLAIEIVAVCPYIIYFEDFKDRIPEKIFISESSDAYDDSWYEILDGLFYNTDEELSVESFRKFYNKNNQRLDDAHTVLKRVNKKLNDTFTKKWKDLSGVKDIESAELKYFPTSSPHFTLKIMDNDGTTFSVDERSRGALWYLSFLMKTEFRSKRMRTDHGKPVFLIDEPASNLHSTAQQNMVGDFHMLAENTSIIYTTHSQYLISLGNIKNTYIIERNGGKVIAERWSTFLQRPKNKRPVTYYQPLANLLNIIPTSFDIPWRKCLITEGPSDRHVLFSMYFLVYDRLPHFAIYPGTTANDLDNLISLNIGWNSDFKILLDSDKKGLEQQRRYIEKYQLSEAQVMTLPITNGKIEHCFDNSESNKLYNYVFKSQLENEITKKEFAAAFAVLSSDKGLLDDLGENKVFKNQTIAFFKKLFESLKLN